MITIDLIDEHFDQPEKPARVQVPRAKAGSGSDQAAQHEVQEQYEAARPGLFAGIWFAIKSLFGL